MLKHPPGYAPYSQHTFFFLFFGGRGGGSSVFIATKFKVCCLGGPCNHIPTSKKNPYRKLARPTCLTYAGENTVVG